MLRMFLNFQVFKGECDGFVFDIFANIEYIIITRFNSAIHYQYKPMANYFV